MEGVRGAAFGRRFSGGARAGALLALSGALAFAAPAMSGPAPTARDRAFAAFVESLRPDAESLGISRATFDRAFAGVRFDASVVAETKRQAEFTLPIADYIAIAVSSDRIDRGRDKARAAAQWLDKAKAAYGVDPGVLLGVWGLETDFGGDCGTFDVVRSLASLAFVRFRDDYFRDELLAALAILEEGDVAPRALVGSWAGASGQTQFMPTSFLDYAVDLEGRGRRDIWTSPADALGSTANFLAAKGWRRDLVWGVEVALPAGFALSDADSSKLAPFASFAARGVVRADGKPLPADGEARLFLPAGLKGPVFLVTANFDAIKSYNPSTAYALAVALLGDAVAGGGRLVASWPPDRPLNPVEVRSLQAKLKTLGYDPGEVDGMVGDAMRGAVRKYQASNGLPPDGYADVALLKRIESDR